MKRLILAAAATTFLTAGAFAQATGNPSSAQPSGVPVPGSSAEGTSVVPAQETAPVTTTDAPPVNTDEQTSNPVPGNQSQVESAVPAQQTAPTTTTDAPPVDSVDQSSTPVPGTSDNTDSVNPTVPVVPGATTTN